MGWQGWASPLSLGLVVVMLAGPALAQGAGVWSQLGGDMGHANVATLSDQPLDVVATFRIDPAPEEYLMPGIFLTPHGPTGMVGVPVDAATQVCQLFRIADVDTGRVERFGATVSCQAGARTLAYDAAHDAIILELDGAATDPMLQSWGALTGEVLWAVGPQAVAEPSGVFDSYDWYLSAFAMDEQAGEVYVGFTQEGTGRHFLEAVSITDGVRRWSTTTPAALFAELPTGSTAGSGQAANFELAGIAATTDGLVVNGLLARVLTPGLSAVPVERPVAAPTYSVPALAWFDRDGKAVGGAAPKMEASDDPSTFQSIAYGAPVALDSLGVALLDDRILVVDPVNARPQEIAVTEIVTGARPAAAWSREALVVPLISTALVFPGGDTSAPRPWPGFEGSTIRRLLIAPPADAYAIVTRLTKDGSVADLVRIDLASARTIDRLPLPFPPADVDSGMNFLPLGDGRLLVVSAEGAAILLAPAAEGLRPQISIENAFPAAGEEFGLVATVAGEARALRVAWGDGVLDRAESGARLVHSYDQSGRRVVRISAQYPDNRTGTAEAIVFVGGTPPEELNAIQTAFDDENQNLTFGILGLVATGVGGLIAVGARVRRRSRLQADLEALERIRERGKTDAGAAVRDLGTFRARIKADLAAGAMDDAQYTTLSHEAVRLLAWLRLRLLGAVQTKLSPDFRHALETALEDGTVTAEEAQALRTSLSAVTALTPAERAKLSALIDGWAAESGPEAGAA